MFLLIITLQNEACTYACARLEGQYRDVRAVGGQLDVLFFFFPDFFHPALALRNKLKYHFLPTVNFNWKKCHKLQLFKHHKKEE